MEVGIAQALDGLHSVDNNNRVRAGFLLFDSQRSYITDRQQGVGGSQHVRSQATQCTSFHLPHLTLQQAIGMHRGAVVYEEDVVIQQLFRIEAFFARQQRVQPLYSRLRPVAAEEVMSIL